MSRPQELPNGYYVGVHDMVGNVAEWINACDASQARPTACETIGGSYTDGNGCTFQSQTPRRTAAKRWVPLL